jgi:hypothetical protein
MSSKMGWRDILAIAKVRGTWDVLNHLLAAQQGNRDGGWFTVDTVVAQQAEINRLSAHLDGRWVMARVSDVIQGLQIIQKYCRQDVHLNGAEHDVIYAPDLDQPMTEEDAAQMDALGWHLDDGAEVWARYC